MPCNLHLYGTNTGRTFITTIANCQKQALLQKNCQKKKILSRALIGSDYHFIGTRCLSKSLELIVKPTQLFNCSFCKFISRLLLNVIESTLGLELHPAWRGSLLLIRRTLQPFQVLASGHTSYFVNEKCW